MVIICRRRLISLGTLSIDDESDDEDEPEVILTDKTILRMSCFVFADVTRRLLRREREEGLFGVLCCT